MEFYFPLRLGLERREAPPRREEQDKRSRLQAYEAWREGTERSLTEYEESPEAQVLKAICHAAPAQRLTFILGEPGAGKSTLFVDWLRRLVREARSEIRLGAKAPVLVRMRSVPAHIWDKDDERGFADALWNHARTERSRLALDDFPENIYGLEPPQCRVFSPIWLFDGLDEVPSSQTEAGREYLPIGDERFYQKLACLPGKKVVSVRTAVYQSLRAVAQGSEWKHYEILGFRTPREQQKFLQQALRAAGSPDAGGKSKSLIAETRRNTAVRLLASNPLMLALIGELAASGEAIALPASRARFYAGAVNRIWHTKLADDPEALSNREERDRFLTQQAAAMGLGALHARLPKLEKNLERGLRNSGLIRVNDGDGSFEFLHLTFQEYYLAQHLRPAGLRLALEKHWSDARYEETLGLLVSILVEEKRFQEVEDGIRGQVNWALDTYKRTPGTLWEIGRSPLRTALHTLSQAGISLGTGEFVRLLEFLWKTLFTARRGPWRETMKYALALDSRTPQELLGPLTADDDGIVRRVVAANASTPPELLARLAADHDRHVRRGVARNANTPPEILSGLAADEDTGVRWTVARNPSTPPDVLAGLAADQDSSVRQGVSANASTPPELLGLMAADGDRYIRTGVALNSSTPPGLLSRLAADRDHHVRAGVALNSCTPPELLARLAANQHTNVSAGEALRANTPPVLLTRLAAYEHKYVCASVALNSTTPPELLARLAADQDPDVRRFLAANSSTPQEVLGRLATEEEIIVRVGVAENTSTSPKLLARLAADQDPDVRSRVAKNASTPPELLARLAADQDRYVRARVAANSSTPPELLRRLAADQDIDVRWGAAGNASTPPELLAHLATDEDHRVRRRVAANASTPPGQLGHLAVDKESDVRWRVAENASLLLEDLIF